MQRNCHVMHVILFSLLRAILSIRSGCVIGSILRKPRGYVGIPADVGIGELDLLHPTDVQVLSIGNETPTAFSAARIIERA